MGRLALKGAIRCETVSATVLPPCCEVSKREDGELEGKEANAPHGLERSCMILIYRIPIRLNLVAKKQQQKNTEQATIHRTAFLEKSDLISAFKKDKCKYAYRHKCLNKKNTIKKQSFIQTAAEDIVLSLLIACKTDFQN